MSRSDWSDHALRRSALGSSLTRLVSFNGRGAPLRAGRYRLAGMCTPLQSIDHLDLFYPPLAQGRRANWGLFTTERHA